MTKKVMLVDDEELFCQTIQMNLEDMADYQVEFTSNPLKAEELANKFQPDIIILDYIMPDKDGSEVYQDLQNNPRTNHIPVIFLTAIATHDEANQHGSNIGGQYIVPKPVTIENLIEAIEINS